MSDELVRLSEQELGKLFSKAPRFRGRLSDGGLQFGVRWVRQGRVQPENLQTTRRRGYVIIAILGGNRNMRWLRDNYRAEVLQLDQRADSVVLHDSAQL